MQSKCRPVGDHASPSAIALLSNAAIRVALRFQEEQSAAKNPAETLLHRPAESGSQEQKVIAGGQRKNTVTPFFLGKRCPGSELSRRVARQAERPTFGKQNATVRSESHGQFHVLYSQPALTPNYAVALDHAVCRELNTPVRPSAQTACGIGAWLDKGQNVRKRVY